MEFQLIQGSSRYNPYIGYDEDFYDGALIDPSEVELDEIILFLRRAAN